MTTIQEDLDQAENLEQAVFMALGAASMCWENPEGAGVFQSGKALEIGEALMNRINREKEMV